MSLADDVRKYCKTTYVDPARQKKQKTITIRSGVITYRPEKIRIISVRRSRKEEVEIYESS
jgi:uncharacterized DUF497 family protein